MALERQWKDQGEVAFGTILRDHPQSPEAKAYYDELYSRLREHGFVAANIAPAEIGSAEWISNSGLFLGRARYAARVQLVEVADTIDEDPNALRHIEGGLVRQRELLGGLVEKYARSIDNPELVSRYVQTFQSPDWHQKLGVKLPDYDPAQDRRADTLMPFTTLGMGVAIGFGLGVAASAIRRRMR